MSATTSRSCDFSGHFTFPSKYKVITQISIYIAWYFPVHTSNNNANWTQVQQRNWRQQTRRKPHGKTRRTCSRIQCTFSNMFCGQMRSGGFLTQVQLYRLTLQFISSDWCPCSSNQGKTRAGWAFSMSRQTNGSFLLPMLRDNQN